ncbi:hypothetical protein BN2476_590063 [Paraburkholderia piptadeniae]|uniref:Uncharacterized protein n=1 Tax=Paraburkholderia piptadeniae TaxID=1701573 RepID=A0A1N7SJV9_9BURK|nr:hypothetical protein BN2476_590063 [Paraburkholderia piptadeniae]
MNDTQCHLRREAVVAIRVKAVVDADLNYRPMPEMGKRLHSIAGQSHAPSNHGPEPDRPLRRDRRIA